MGHWHVPCCLKISIWHTPTVMLLQPQHSSWEPFSSFAATSGQLHCQNSSIHSSQNIFLDLKCLVNVASSCGRLGPHSILHKGEERQLTGETPQKGGLGLVKLYEDTHWIPQAQRSWQFSPRASLSAVRLLWNLTLKQQSHEWHRSLQPLTWTLSLRNLGAITSLFLQAVLCPL